jgi:Cadherin domain
LLNYESGTTAYDIVVLASSADGSSQSATFTIGVTDSDEFDVGAVTDSDVGLNTVNENATNGTLVGLTAVATDLDATNSSITYSLSDTAGGRFTIDALSGVVSVADGTLLDAEASMSHAITVLATSSDGSASSQAFSITVGDVNDHVVGAVTDTDATAEIIAENAATGTAVGITALAIDPDISSNTVTYNLSDDAGGRFAIDANSGVVTVADGSLLNYENFTSHDITVVATSSDGSSSSLTVSITLSDVDEFDASMPTDDDATANSVAENSANGATVGITALATDLDGTNHTITYSLSDDAGGRFAIDATSGIVSVADGSLLDAETTTSHTITVLATSSDGSASSQAFSVGIVDADDHDISVITDADASAQLISENAATGTAVGITALASDADITNHDITYSLSDDAGGRFAIDASSGMVTVANGSLLNYESITSHTITIVATSSDGSSSSLITSIDLTDVDEFDVNAPSDSDASTNSVTESAVNGTAVGITALATDLDGSNHAITYSLSDDAGGRFTIDATSGIVTVGNGALLDAEAATSHGITVLATSSDGSSNTRTFLITVMDLDDHDVGVLTDADPASAVVAENAAQGSTVGITALASDQDITNNAITYSLSDDAGGRFTIAATSGIVTVSDGTLLNYEGVNRHDITVVATSLDGSSSSQPFTIFLTDVDEFDVGAVSDSDGSLNAVAENASNGTLVGLTALATDLDATHNAISYSLSDTAGGRFSIDALSGVVSVADGSLLDAELSTSHTITVLASSNDGSTSSQRFSITIDDVNDHAVGAISDTDAAAEHLAENATTGTAVGVTAMALDPDITNNTVTYSLSDDAGGRFAIEAASGIVSVANATLLDAETATLHNITVVATSGDGSFSSQAFSIAIMDVNEYGLGNIVDADARLDALYESAANGSTVGVTAQAIDQDATNRSVVYSLSDDAGGRFAIDAISGVIVVANASLIDHELEATHTIVILATSSDGSSTTLTATLQLQDINDNAPRFVQPDQDGSGIINMAEGQLPVTTVLANDADSLSSISYEIAGGADADLFVITPDGTLRFKAAPSYFSPSDANQDQVYEVIVMATDGTLTQQLPLQIVIDRPQTGSWSLGLMPEPTAVPTDAATDASLGLEGSADAPPPTPERPAVIPASPARAPASGLLDEGASLTDLHSNHANQAGPGAGARHVNPSLASFDAAALWAHAVDPIYIQLTERQIHLQRSGASVLSTVGLDLGARPSWGSPDQDAQGQEVILQATVFKVGGISLSLGAVWWAARAGGLMSSLLLSTPAWRVLDPLPVFMGKSDEDDDTLQSDEEATAEQLFEARRTIRSADEIIQ